MLKHVVQLHKWSLISPWGYILTKWNQLIPLCPSFPYCCGSYHYLDHDSLEAIIQQTVLPFSIVRLQLFSFFLWTWILVSSNYKHFLLPWSLKYLNITCLFLLSSNIKKIVTNPSSPMSFAGVLCLLHRDQSTVLASTWSRQQCLNMSWCGRGFWESELAATSGGGLGDERWQLCWGERSQFPGGKGSLLFYSLHLFPNTICVNQLPLGLKGLYCQMLPFPLLEAKAKPLLTLPPEGESSRATWW